MVEIAKIFMSGGSQAVRLPKKFRFDAREVRVEQKGTTLVLTPVETDAALLFARLDAIGGGFPSRPAQGRARKRKSF
jgi:antitoxin VapB